MTFLPFSPPTTVFPFPLHYFTYIYRDTQEKEGAPQRTVNNPHKATMAPSPLSVQKSKLLYLQLLLLFIFFFIATLSFSLAEEVNAIRGQREFDYFKLALQWPGTYCRHTHHCCRKNACCLGSNAPAEFTIHGLWPDYNDGTWPACCSRCDFDEREISMLRDALEKYWPSLSCGSPSTCFGGKGSFWAHEWEKHGTCSFPVVQDEYNYFLTTLNVYFKYNVTRVLYEAGYVPSNTEKYPLGGIVSAIENAFHATPSLACSKGAVEEICLCFYKDFKPRDCALGSIIQDNRLSSRHYCPEYVSLPTYVPLGLDGANSTVSWMDT